jgi:hypothetical protein
LIKNNHISKKRQELIEDNKHKIPKHIIDFAQRFNDGAGLDNILLKRELDSKILDYQKQLVKRPSK